MKPEYESRLDRLRSERLMRRIETAVAVFGLLLIAAGVGLYIATAPPIGGLHWDTDSVVASVALVLAGIAVYISSRLHGGKR